MAEIDIEDTEAEEVDKGRNRDNADKIKNDARPDHIRHSDLSAAEDDGIGRGGHRQHEGA